MLTLKQKRIFSTSTKGNSITYNAPANEFDLCVMKVKGWEDESQVETDKPITLNVRMVSCPKNLNDSANYVYTNVQQVKFTHTSSKRVCHNSGILLVVLLPMLVGAMILA